MFPRLGVKNLELFETDLERKLQQKPSVPVETNDIWLFL